MMASSCNDKIPTDEESKPMPSKESLLWNQIKPTWDPSFVQSRPLAGLFALCIALCCIFASLGILLTSNGKTTDSWPVQPSVYLAIIAAITNTALLVARAQALPIDWWYRAYRGSTVNELELRWKVGSSLISAIRYSNTYISHASIASLALALFIVDGPFLQRASTVEPGLLLSNVTLEMMLAPELPTGFSGYIKDGMFYQSPKSLSVVQGWMRKDPIMAGINKCEGICSGTVRGPGVVKSRCSLKTWPITSEILHSPNATWGDWKGSVFYGIEEWHILSFFEVLLGQPTDGLHSPEAVFIEVGRMGFFDLEGKYERKSCILLPAIVNYDVLIENSQISLNHQEDQRKFVAFANNTASFTIEGSMAQKQMTTLETLSGAVASIVQSNVTAGFPVSPSPDSQWELMTSTFNTEAAKHYNFSNGINDTNFFDPMPGIITDYNELMFRAGIAAADWPNLPDLMDPGLSAMQTLHAQQRKKQNIFRSDLRWWAAAAAFDLFTVLLVLPLFNHWWSFERYRPLSPFELALAFDSPLVNHAFSNAGAKGIMNHLGDTSVKFGAVESRECVLEENKAHDSRPSQSSNYQVMSLGLRLGIGRAEHVATPSKGMAFAR